MNTGEEQKHAGKEECKTETKNSESNMSDLSKWWHDPAHVIQSIGIFIGTIVALIYAGQLCQMIKQNQLTRETFTTDKRAWIGVSKVAGKPILNNPFIAHMEFINTGKTPAIEASVTFVGEPLPKGVSPDFTREDKVPLDYHGLIMPNAPYHMKVPLTNNDEPLNQAGWKDIDSETVIYWIHGFVPYEDIFGCPHKLTYCYAFSKEQGEFSPCRDHNTTDDNKCKN